MHYISPGFVVKSSEDFFLILTVCSLYPDTSIPNLCLDDLKLSFSEHHYWAVRFQTHLLLTLALPESASIEKQKDAFGVASSVFDSTNRFDCKWLTMNNRHGYGMFTKPPP
jgi:hypothetical protein